MARPRRFSREVTLEVVQRVESGAARAAPRKGARQVCREHQLDERQLRNAVLKRGIQLAARGERRYPEGTR